MVINRLEIENFGSFRDHQVLDLRVPRSVRELPERFAPIFEGAEIRVPKVVVLLGPNGSGKSTALGAVAFLAWFLRESFGVDGPSLPCRQFNDAESAARPVKLAVELGGRIDFAAPAAEPAPEVAGTLRYELELEVVDGLVRRCAREALRFRSRGEGKWRRVFERDGSGAVRGSDAFPLAGYAQVVDKIRDNASVVSTLALFKHAPSIALAKAANGVTGNYWFGRFEPSDPQLIEFLAREPEIVAALNREIERIDLGVDGIRVELGPSGPLLLFSHRGLQFPMPWEFESHGTRSFIRSFPHLFRALHYGGIAVVDELDAAIHPSLLPEIFRWFHDPERNPHGAQLWASCHAASLLDDAVKEEIVFCEKDAQGRSSLYSLMDVGDVRRGDNLYKKYMGGTYGAVPLVG